MIAPVDNEVTDGEAGAPPTLVSTPVLVSETTFANDFLPVHRAAATFLNETSLVGSRTFG